MEEAASLFAFLWYVVCVLSVMVCFDFLIVSLVGYVRVCGCSWTRLCYVLLLTSSMRYMCGSFVPFGHSIVG